MTFVAGTAIEFAVSSVHSIAQHSKLATLVLQPGQTFRAVPAKMNGCDQNSLPNLNPGNILAGFNDFSCYVTAWNMRQSHARQSFTHPDIKMIQRARLTRTST